MDAPLVLVAFVTPSTVDINLVFESAMEKLPHYMIPSIVVPVYTFPLNGNGKVDKNALAELGKSYHAKRTSLNTEFELIQAEMISGFLHIHCTQIYKETTIFDLGLDSIKLVSFVQKLRMEFETSERLNLERLYRIRSVGKLAKFLESGQSPIRPGLSPVRTRLNLLQGTSFMTTPMKVLILHGNPGNESWAKATFQPLLDLFGTHCQTNFLNGPLEFDIEEKPALFDLLEDKKMRHWFRWTGFCEQEIRNSIRLIQDVVDQMEYLDALIGFSAGGTMIHLLDVLASKRIIERKWKVSVFVSSLPLELLTKCDDIPTEMRYGEVLDYPTICVAGNKESTEMQTIMPSRYSHPTIIRHEGSHEVPTSDSFFVQFSEELSSLCEAQRLQ